MKSFLFGKSLYLSIAALIATLLLAYLLFRPQPVSVNLILPDPATLARYPLPYDTPTEVRGRVVYDYEADQPFAYYLVIDQGPILELDDSSLSDLVGSRVLATGTILNRGSSRVPLFQPETIELSLIEAY